MAENDNKSNGKGTGPLTQVIKDGAKTGIETKKIDDKAKEKDLVKDAKATVASEPAISSSKTNEVLKNMLKATSVEGRKKAIQLAGKTGGAELATEIALAAVYKDNSTSSEDRMAIAKAAIIALSEILKREGNATVPYLEKAIVDPKNAIDQWGDIYITSAHLEVISNAIASAKLVAALPIMEKMLEFTGLGSCRVSGTLKDLAEAAADDKNLPMDKALEVLDKIGQLGKDNDGIEVTVANAMAKLMNVQLD